MTLDPTKDAISLDVTNEEMSSREKQNRYGQKYNRIENVGNAGFLSIIVVTSQVKPSAEQWYSVLSDLQTKVGVTGMQALFEMPIYEPEEGCQNSLHTTAHLRQDDVRQDDVRQDDVFITEL